MTLQNLCYWCRHSSKQRLRQSSRFRQASSIAHPPCVSYWLKAIAAIVLIISLHQEKQTNLINDIFNNKKYKRERKIVAMKKKKHPNAP